ncbi:MAG TPA: NifU family protein [Jatrophihabitans sp.]|jgi:Fe-S cluster biogenesis protein NfuA/nitrite reductase/ring-hydroxylating ferredoxin subunit|nr:NifU family protein [Jatrophihabitans sp.]
MTEPGPVPSARPDWRQAGERIDTLLDASSAGGVVARERAEELVRLVADLYGAGLERVLELMHERGHLDEQTLDALAADDLVASLLLVHGLHPYGVATRVEKALAGVRPYLGSHGGDVELLGITDDGVVRLRLLGSCDGCASSSVTLKLAVEGAIQSAAPEITAIEVQTPTESASPVIPMNALFARVSSRAADDTASAWEQVADLVDLPSGSVRHVTVGQTPVLACRAGTDLFAFVDRCARCELVLTGATVSRRLGGPADAAVLTCGSCRAHYDVRRAGAGLDDDGLHLDPLPLLADGVTVSIAVPAAVSA